MKFTKIKGEGPRSIIRLPRVGKLRLGIKKVSKSGKEYPTETDFFVCPPEVQARFGAEPKSLPVMIPVEDEEQFLRQYYAVYGGNQKLKCQGDGQQAERRDDNGQIELIACQSPTDCDFGKKNKCSARIDLMLVLPDINCGATYQLSTGSINSDIDIRSGLEMAKHLFGRISWVPLQLVREERKIPDPATGKMQTHWPVKLYPTATIAEANIIRQDTKRILERQQNFALEEPVIEGHMSDALIQIISDEDAIEIEKAQGVKVSAKLPANVVEAPVQPSVPEEPAITCQSVLDKVGALQTQADIDGLMKWHTENEPAIKKLPQGDRDVIRAAFKKKSEEVQAAEQEKLFSGFKTTIEASVTVEALDKIMEIAEKSLKSEESKVKLKFRRDAKASEIKKKKMGK